MDSSVSSASERTIIYCFRSSGEDLVGYVAGETIFRLRWNAGIPIGRVERAQNGWHIFRNTRYQEKELGSISPDRRIRSHGLFEGGEFGWLDSDGTVIQGGLIFGEEEVGRVDGPQPLPAAAALLLIFIPEEEEVGREMKR